MEDKRFVCLYPESEYCGNPNCSLSHLCKSKPLADANFVYDQMRKRNRVRKTDAEIREHQRLYQMYNRMFGNSREKKIEYSRAYYKEHREEILRKKKKPYSERTSVLCQCDFPCSECPYEDCIKEGYGNRKEYMDLYYKKFHEKLLENKAEYRKTHRAYLANSEKLRNYKNKGYLIIQVIHEKQHGTLTNILINGKPYASFVSKDKLSSFRIKIHELHEDEDVIVVIAEKDKKYIFKKEKCS